MNVIVDMSSTEMVDHTVMAKLRELEREFADQGISVAIVGMEAHVRFSTHPSSTA